MFKTLSFKINFSLIIFILTSFFIANIAHGQIAKDSTIVDTTVINLTPRLDVDFYDSLRTKMQKNVITREISHIIFVKKKTATSKADSANNFRKSENPFLAYQGKVIRRIYIKKLPAFGTSVDDTTLVAESILQKFSNNTYFKPRDRIIRDNIVVKTGEKIDAKILSENERVIRNLSYIHDARIYIKEISLISDSVDLVFVTRDVYSYGFEINMHSIENYDFKIYDVNILGTGQRASHRISVYPKENLPIGYQGQLKVDNLAGSFVSLEGDYQRNYQTEVSQIIANRNFIIQKIKYAGGISLMQNLTFLQFLNESEQMVTQALTYHSADMWLGRSFKIDCQKDYSSFLNSLQLSSRLIFTDYNSLTPEMITAHVQTANSTTVLVSCTYSKQQFYTGSMIYSYGKTEDVPFGTKFDITTGIENAKTTRIYSGFRFLTGKMTIFKGYQSYNFGLGGFVNNKHIEDGVFTLKTNYFSKYIRLQNYGLRQFVKSSLLIGFNSAKHDSVNINNDNGIPGLNSDYMWGNRSFSANCETVIFTPWNLLQFRFAFFTFYDFGFIGWKKFVFANQFYEGMGFGFRFRNENLVLPTLQISFAYYPIVPVQAGVSKINISNSPSLSFDNFYGTLPTIIGLQ